ncbi:MAG: TonB-dependent receptor, partial [Bacteroidota bacterium]|nr:TonB-dependent receptor [Bacteroidota bacterium]
MEQSYSQELVSLTGIVKDEEDMPLELVVITINEIPASTISDKQGKFAFRKIQTGIYHITFSRTGFASTTLTKEITDADNNLYTTLNKSLIETTTIDVTGSFKPIDISNSTFALTSINTRALNGIKNEKLGSTIQSIPGVNNISTGINLGKPVIRGLTSNGVIILIDGVKHESQQWGDEHGPEISLFDLDRIEILRGPASLIYGADGIGGAINIISKPLSYSNLNKNIYYGAVDLSGYSVSNMGAGNLTLGYGNNFFSIKGYFGARRSGNVKTPEGNLTVNEITFDQGKEIRGTRIITGGELFNSGSNEYEGGFKFGYRGKKFNLEGGFENFRRELEIHEDPEEDPSATPNQRINTSHFELKSSLVLSNLIQLEPVLSYETQDRKEFESTEDKELDTEALHLNLKNFEGSLKLHHSLNRYISGTAGISFADQRNRSLVEEKLIPNFNSRSIGVYVLEKLIKDKFSISIGGRFDTKKLNTLNTDFGNRILEAQSLTFNSFSGSIGGVFKPAKDLDVFINIGRGWRPPSEFELYVDGVHEGTLRYERGILTQNPSAQPEPEFSLNTDIGLRFRTKNITGEISLFRNVINNFIYPSNTGITDSASGFPVFDVNQAKSTFTGYEYNFQISPYGWLLVTASGDYVKTQNDATGNPLPFIPPAKNIIEIKLQRSEIKRLYNPYIKFS